MDAFHAPPRQVAVERVEDGTEETAADAHQHEEDDVVKIPQLTLGLIRRTDELAEGEKTCTWCGNERR